MNIFINWIKDPAHIALVASEALALLPIRYSGLIQGFLKAVIERGK
jgi:hypothetical protein